MNSSHVLVLPSWYPSHPSDVNGVFFRDQALALSDYGHKVGVVAVNLRSLRTLGRRQESLGMPRYEVDKGIPTYRRQIWAALPRIPHGNYQLWRRAARPLLKRYVREQGCPDVIHAHSAIYAGAVAVEWGREYGAPVVLTEHSTGFARGVYRQWQLRLAEKAATGSDVCVAVSPALGEVLGEKLPKSDGRWRWVPNVVAGRFDGESTQDRNHEAPVRFLNLAIMTAKRGQMDLLEAFAHAFRNSGGSAELWMGGDGPLRDELESRARQLHISHQVRFLGQVSPDDVPALLSEVDAMVVASHYETFGVVAADALMCGVPVVATRCGGPECIVEAEDGYLAPPRDPEGLAKAMVKVAESTHRVNRQAIAERAQARFSGEAIARRLTTIYNEVILDKSATPKRTV
ncbi:glycosyltransferase [Spiribacter roseus]|uniref:Glycosyltransferase n=1 Tax=Spiribacter roseus TaxID=1855875 RepID=A0ABV3RZX7_9GAMM